MVIAGEALHRGDIGQMAAEGFLVDRKVIVKRQQDGGNDAFRNEVARNAAWFELLSQDRPDASTDHASPHLRTDGRQAMQRLP